jgi:RNA polymerase sigma-70 factor (ECF subfamily)
MVVAAARQPWRSGERGVTQPDPEVMADGAQFASTCWTIVANAADPGSPQVRQALAQLCQAYWYPLYAFVRWRGYPPEQAEDLTQEFFADLLSRGTLGAADPAKGRFRAFLLRSLENFLANHRVRERRFKRGGGVKHFSIDLCNAEGRYRLEPAHEATAERLFERSWALTLLDLVLDRLERTMSEQGKGDLFRRLKPTLAGGPEAVSYIEIGAALGMTDGAVRVAAHRLRKGYRTILNEEIARTIADPAEVDEEIKDLFLALR